MKENVTKQEPPKNQENWRTFFWAVGIAVFIRIFFIQPYAVASGSMEESLLVGDMIFVNRLTYGPKVPFTDFRIKGFTEPQRGDVIVFKFPFDAPLFKRTYVKRLVAIPGDTIQIIDKGLYINGALQENPEHAKFVDNNIIPKYLNDPRIFNECGNRDNFGPLIIPAGYYFVVGDNRDSSWDSRFWGMVPEENIHGKASLFYSPGTTKFQFTM